MTTLDPFGLPPEEAMRWFRDKGFKASFDWREVMDEQHARAFTVAKATQFSILATLRESVDHAIRSGGTLGEFRKQLKPVLQAKGWWGEKEAVDPETGETKLVQLGSASRLRTIYETNLRTSQAAGRWERFERTKAARPYARYVCLTDGNERAEHRAWHGTVLPIDDPWWDTHAPPNGWGCRCKMMQLSDRDLTRFGFSVNDKPPPSPTVSWTNERTGQTMRIPKGIDPGFAYNPGKAPRGFTPPDHAPALANVRTFRDEKRPTADELVAAGDLLKPSERWDDVRDRAELERRLTALFKGKATKEAADPRGLQVTFSPAFLDVVKSERKNVPLAKQTVERPTEIWMVPHRLKDGSVVMRQRYIGVFEGGQVVVVDRDDAGNAVWSTSSSPKGVDAKREGYLLWSK